MRKNVNTEHFEGRVYSHDLALKVTGPTSKNPGTEYISGNLKIATDEAGLNIVEQHFTYVTEKTKKGSANATFAVLKQIVDGAKTWLTDSKDEALKVKIDTSIALNDFYTGEGENEQLVSVKRNEGGFVTVVSDIVEDENERCTWTADMVITNIAHVDENEEKHIAEHTSVKGAIFNFRNEILPVEFSVENPAGMGYFEGLEVTGANPVYTKVWGHVISAVTKQEITEESAFGEASVRVVERSTKKWVITGTAKVPYDFGDEEALTAEDLTKASQDREKMLAEKKKNAEEWRASQATPTPTPKANAAAPAKQGGFGF